MAERGRALWVGAKSQIAGEKGPTRGGARLCARNSGRIPRYPRAAGAQPCAPTVWSYAPILRVTLSAIMYLIFRWLINTLALFIVVTLLSPHLHARTFVTLVIAAAVLGLLNAIIKPVLVILTLPLTVVTLGLFLIILNAIMLELTAWLVS